MAWELQLHEEDLQKISSISWSLVSTKRANNVRTKKYDPTRDDLEITQTGLMGEVAFARALGVEPDWSVLLGGDAGYDLVVGHQTIQIKTPHGKATRDWFYVNDLSLMSADYGVLCNVTDSETVVIRGFISQLRFIELHQVKNWGFGDRCAVHVESMFNPAPLVRGFQLGKNFTLGKQINAH